MTFALAATHELVKFIGLLLIGQGLVYVMSFGRHERNPVYRTFRFLTSPVVWGVRRITPAKVANHHVPVVSFFLMFWVWVALIFVRHDLMQGGA
jgi:hypothetical protein